MDEEKQKLLDENAKLQKELADTKVASDAKAKEAEEATAKATALATEKAALEEQMRKQGQNFKKLRDMSEAEKASMTADQRANAERMEKLEAELEAEKADRVKEKVTARDTAKESLFKRLAGANAALRAEIEEKYNNLAGMPEENPLQVEARILEASKMVAWPGANPLNRGFSGGGAGNYGEHDGGTTGAKTFADTESGKELAGKLGIALEVPKK